MGVTDTVRGECLVGVSSGLGRDWGEKMPKLGSFVEHFMAPPRNGMPKTKVSPVCNVFALRGNIYSIFRFVFQASPTGHKFEANKATMVRQYVTRPFRR